MNLSNIKTTVTQFVGRTGLKLQKHSPEILIGVGIVTTIGAIAAAVIATKKSEEIIEDHQFDVGLVKKDFGQNFEPGHYPEPMYKEDEKEYKHELTKVYVHTGLKLAKLYTPTVLLTATSIASFLGAYGIVHKRNVALTAAYTAVSEAFKSYRKAVVEELGEEKDDQFRHGLALKTETLDDGTVQTKLTPVSKEPGDYSQYAKFFDEASRNWKNSPEHNLAFLKCQQDYCNQLLRINGHLFLNEVYDRLDVPRTKAGALVGWVLGDGNENCVDFGISDGRSEAVRDFVNGYEPSILLDFNVDGPIYDLI